MSKVNEKSKQESVSLRDKQYKIVVDNIRKVYDVRSQNGQDNEEFLAVDNFNLKVSLLRW